eukprot:gene2698-5311_t
MQPFDEEECLQLLRDVARGDARYDRNEERRQINKSFIPLYKHPLPLSNHRYKHEANLRRISSCALNKQAKGAVTIGDAWVLEEVYMRGAPVDLQDTNGFTPLHIACQLNNFNAVMVLLNIQVDINVLSTAGYTPLYMAHAAKASQCVTLLQESNAKYTIALTSIPGSALLLETKYKDPQYVENSVLHINANDLCVPHEHKSY